MSSSSPEADTGTARDLSDQPASPNVVDNRQGTFIAGSQYNMGGDYRGAQVNIGSTIITAEQSYRVAGLPNPYLGLRAFTYAERGLFAGREQEIADAVGLLTRPGAQRPLLFVTGASGSGKSSLVQAGLAPALDAHYRARQRTVRPPAVLRPGAHPLPALADALDLLGLPPAQAADAAALAARIASIPPDHINLIILDQFEELFAAGCDPAERDGLLGLLADLPPFDALRTHIIVTMRADFLPDLFQHLALYNLAKQGLDLRAMGVEALKTAIQRPLQQHPDKRIEPALVERLAAATAADAAALPLLQVTLEKLFADGELTLAAYETPVAAGGCGGTIGGAIRQRAEQVFHCGSGQQPRPPDEQSSLLDLMLDLVAVSLGDDAHRDVRRSQTVAALLRGAPEAQARRRRLIGELCAARLLSASNVNNDDDRIDDHDVQIDIIHESLIANWDRLKAAIGAQREQLQQRERFRMALAEWQDHAGQSDADAYLLSGVWLAEAEALAARDDIALRDGAAQMLLRQSVARRDRERQRQVRQTRMVAGVLGVLALLALAAAGFALSQQREAQRQTQIVRSQSLVAQSNEARIGGFPERAGLLAIEAISVTLATGERPTIGSDQALRDALANLGGRALRGHAGPVTHLALSKDGNTLVTGSDDKTVRVWKLGDADPNASALSLDAGSITSLALSKDGTTLAVGSDDGYAQVWNLGNEDPAASVRALHVYTDGVVLVALSADGRKLVTGSNYVSGFLSVGPGDINAQLWNLSEPQPTARQLAGHTAPIQALALSPDGQTLVTGSADGTVRVWDLSGPGPISSRYQWKVGLEGAVTNLALRADGKMLVTDSVDSMAVWDLSASDPSETWRRLPGVVSNVDALALNAYKQLVVTGGTNNIIWVWNLAADDDMPQVLSGHTDAISALAFTTDSRTLVSVSRDGTARLWDPTPNTSSASLGVLRSHEGPIHALALSQDGRTLITGSADGSARVWNLITPTISSAVRVLQGAQDVAALTLSADGHTLIATSNNGSGVIWELTGSTPLNHPLPPPETDSETYGRILSEDGRLIFTRDSDGLHRWELSDSDGSYRWSRSVANPITSTFVMQAGEICSYPTGPSIEGTMLATVCSDYSMQIWDLSDTGLLSNIRNLPISFRQVRALAVSSDKQTLFVSLETSVTQDGFIQDSTVQLWDLTSTDLTTPTKTLSGHTATVTSLLPSEDGRTLISGSDDGTVRVWDLAQGGRILHVLRGHTGAVTVLALRADGHTLLSGSDDGTVRVWDLAAEDPTATARVLRGHAAGVVALASGSDGHRLFSADSSGTVLEWSLDIPDMITPACRVIGRNLSQDEWELSFSATPYRRTCPEQPGGWGAAPAASE